MIQEIQTEVTNKVTKLVEKYEALEILKGTVLVELETLRQEIKTPLQGSIVMKKVCCHKKGCTTCGRTQNAHGPYPHLQWWDESGKLKTKYISRKNLPIFEEQLKLSKKRINRERLLIKIQDRQHKIFLTMEGVLVRLNGKEVNQNV
ncbi:MAG: DUF6788 family protein [Tepidibacillus sp.]